MADKRISELNPLSSADLDAASDVLAVADLSASETKKVTPTALIVGAVGVVPDGTIPGSKIEPDSITSLELAPDSVTDVELADNAVDTAAIQNKAVTQEKLADDAVGTDQLADGAVTGDKLADGAVGTAQIADRSIPAIKLEQNTLTAEEIAPNAIGASELADNAVDTPAVATDALATRHYQNESVTNEKLANGIDGGKLIDGSVPGSKIEPGSISGDSLDEVPLDKLPDAAANTVLAGPAAGVPASPSYRKLVANDLPTATQSAKGGVSVPAAGGLEVDASGAVSIGNSVSPATHPVITYDANGLVTAGRGLSSTDLPSGSGSEVGAAACGGARARCSQQREMLWLRPAAAAAGPEARSSIIRLHSGSRKTGRFMSHPFCPWRSEVSRTKLRWTIAEPPVGGEREQEVCVCVRVDQVECDRLARAPRDPAVYATRRAGEARWHQPAVQLSICRSPVKMFTSSTGAPKL